MESMTRTLPGEADTILLAQDIAMALRPGETIALAGDLGAGKSTLARAMIRALAGDPELEVPSPTYTLCQRYDLVFPVSHFDLYRISGEAEMAELGFDEVIETGAALVEWPDRALGAMPQ
ncbi:MAG TPA: tRNA (adenosine(37)-N6)-threonylcarbamoyltransferase complex ATPase subunit type 1 TsaE, partial [Rhizobiaceae bacterium]|nr:tRNA (adenosine(37)-N6)-threonylcarbamoyltransferase complex ATPase subunit type 1 TsaE [Rhizobiaceae bacterium]